jgi:hypothetical protein
MADEAMKYQVFLSYGRPDVEAVTAFHNMLTDRGVAAWMDLASLRGGEDWRAVVRKALNESQLVVFFLSNETVLRPGFLQAEIVESLEISRSRSPEDVYVIPVRLDDCQLHPRLESLHCVSVTNNSSRLRLLEQILRHRDRYFLTQRASVLSAKNCAPKIKSPGRAQRAW